MRAQRPGLPTPPTSTPPPDRPKLRNSCHACASSKLKCPQEKPTCSRCARRGVACEYVAAKRGGRKPKNRSTITEPGDNDVSNTGMNANDNVHLASQANWFAPFSSNPSIDPLPSPAIIHPSTTANVSASSDMLPDFFGPMDQNPGLSSTSTDTETDLDGLFATPMSLSTEMSDVNIFGTSDFFPTGIDSSNGPESLSGAFPGFEDAMTELLALSIPSAVPENPPSTSREAHNYQEASSTDSPCSCLVQALGFMKQLFPSSLTLTAQGLDKATAIPTIQAVISQNEATIEAVSKMLECSCSQDGYLLAVMSLIIFRVLGHYAAVARKMPSLPGPQACRSPQPSASEHVLQNPSAVGSYCLDGADSARMAAQLVLSELHRVRRLVNQLSSKLKMQATKKGRAGAETPESLDLDDAMTLPLSAVMYDQLDVDLRKRLKVLSWEMIDRLRTL